MAKLLFNKKITKQEAHAHIVKEHKKKRLILRASLTANVIMALAIGALLWLM